MLTLIGMGKHLLIAAIAATVAGCVSTAPEPEEPPLTGNICVDGSRFLGNPWLDDWQKRVVYEKMQNSGCMS